jgi:hypothetical protein
MRSVQHIDWNEMTINGLSLEVKVLVDSIRTPLEQPSAGLKSWIRMFGLRITRGKRFVAHPGYHFGS